MHLHINYYYYWANESNYRNYWKNYELRIIIVLYRILNDVVLWREPESVWHGPVNLISFLQVQRKLFVTEVIGKSVRLSKEHYTTIVTSITMNLQRFINYQQLHQNIYLLDWNWKQNYYATHLCRGIAGIKTFVKRSGSVLENINIAQGNVLEQKSVWWPSNRHWKLWYPFQLLRQQEVERVAGDFPQRENIKLTAFNQRMIVSVYGGTTHEALDAKQLKCYRSWTTIELAENNDLWSTM